MKNVSEREGMTFKRSASNIANIGDIGKIANLSFLSKLLCFSEIAPLLPLTLAVEARLSAICTPTCFVNLNLG